jgi:uncharacterized C2H2 Zn-finger protein
VVRAKFIENHQRLDEKILQAQCEADDMIEEEEEETFIEYEEIEVKVSDRIYNSELHEILEEELPVEEIYDESNDNDDDSEEELKLEDIVKPEFLHYCLPKKEPDNKRSKSTHKGSSIRSKKTEVMCEECGKLFSNPVSVKQHITLVHRKIKFNCEFENCGRVFTTQLHLSKHIAAFHKNTSTIPCHVCNKLFQSETELSAHVNVSHPDGYNEEYKCEICSQHLISYKVFQNHMKKHREAKYACEICDKKFTHKLHLTNHLVLHKNSIAL